MVFCRRSFADAQDDKGDDQDDKGESLDQDDKGESLAQDDKGTIRMTPSLSC